MAGILPPAERRTRLLLATYVVVSLVLLMVGERLPQGLLRGAGAALFAPLDRLVMVGDRLAATWRESEQLHQRVTELELESVRLRDAARENRRLRDSLGLPAFVPPRLRPAELLALSGEAVPASATLAAGTRQGVREGDVVVTHDGLVGRIAEAWGNASRVALLTDPTAPVACEIDSTGVLGIVRYSAAPRPRLLFTGVPFTDTVRVGERVLTSPLSRRFPRGIPVGRVRRVGTDPSGLMQEIEVAPAAALTRLRHVFVTPGPPPIVLRPATPASGAPR